MLKNKLKLLKYIGFKFIILRYNNENFEEERMGEGITTNFADKNF